MSKTRKDRSDIQVGNLEKKHDLDPGTIRNPDESDARSDKELGNLERAYGEEALKDTLGCHELDATSELRIYSHGWLAD